MDIDLQNLKFNVEAYRINPTRFGVWGLRFIVYRL